MSALKVKNLSRFVSATNLTEKSPYDAQNTIISIQWGPRVRTDICQSLESPIFHGTATLDLSVDTETKLGSEATRH